MLFKEFVFAFTIPFTFLEIMKTFVLAGTSINDWVLKFSLTQTRLFTLRDSARFKLSVSSFLVTFLIDTA